jgi:hypothetical protein
VQQLDTQKALVDQYEGTIESDEGQLNTAQGEPAVHAHRLAGHRPRRIAPGRSGQLRDARRCQRHRRRQSIAADHGDLSDSGGQRDAVVQHLHDGAVLKVEAYDRTNSTKLADGKLLTVDNAIDTTTGTVKLRAQFATPTARCFRTNSSTSIARGCAAEQLIIPNCGGASRRAERRVTNFVYLVNSDSTVPVRPVTLGTVDGDRAAALGAARGRLPDHPGADLLSRRQPRGDDLVGHRAARAQFGQMPGLNQMSSTSSAGASVITLQFNPGLSLDVAEQEVQAAINAAGNLLPPTCRRPPIYAKVNPGRRADPDARASPRRRAADRGRGPGRHALAQKISQLPGVGLVSISGGQRPAVRIQANPQARRLRAQHRRPAHHHRQRQRQHAEGQFRRADARLHDQRQRPAQSAEEYGTSSSPTRTARRCGCRRRRRVDGAENTSSAPG